jgi:hypothetical protein
MGSARAQQTALRQVRAQSAELLARLGHSLFTRSGAGCGVRSAGRGIEQAPRPYAASGTRPCHLLPLTRTSAGWDAPQPGSNFGLHRSRRGGSRPLTAAGPQTCLPPASKPRSRCRTAGRNLERPVISAAAPCPGAGWCRGIVRPVRAREVKASVATRSALRVTSGNTDGAPTGRHRTQVPVRTPELEVVNRTFRSRGCVPDHLWKGRLGHPPAPPRRTPVGQVGMNTGAAFSHSTERCRPRPWAPAP